MRSFLILALILLTVSIGKAQYYDASPSLVLNVEGAQPVSNWKLINSGGIGGSLKLRIPSGQVSDVILSATLMQFMGKTFNKRKSNGNLTATALAGYRYYLNPLADYSSFYIQADAGLGAVGKDFIVPAIGGSLGYLINDRIDLSVRGLTALSSDIKKQIRFISIGVGYGLNFH